MKIISRGKRITVEQIGVTSYYGIKERRSKKKYLKKAPCFKLFKFRFKNPSTRRTVKTNFNKLEDIERTENNVER